MLNKKRLAMIAIAASMVLPTNLTYLSVVTPVLAEGDPTPITTTFLDEAFDLTPGTITTTSSGNSYVLPAGNHSLTKDIPNLDKPLLIDDGVITTIDLAGHSITSTSVDWIFRIYGNNNASLTLTGNGTLTNQATGASAVIGVNEGKLILDSSSTITLNNESTHDSSYGICVYESGDTSVEVNNATITAQNGVYISGNISPDVNSEVKLNNVKIDAKDGGIYHAGAASLTVEGEKTSIKGANFGIETRAGNLTVKEDTTIEGGTGSIISVANSNGSTTQNVGIAIAQHTTKYPIEVNITGSTIKGGAALFIGNPQGNGEEDLKKIEEVNVSKAQLQGTTYDVAYSEDVIPFKLTNTGLTANKIQKVTLENGTATEVKADQEKLPYTIVLDLTPSGDAVEENATIPANVLAILATESTNEDGETEKTLNVTVDKNALPETYQDLPFESFKEDGLTEETLGNALTAKSSTVGVPDLENEGETITPNYQFSVSGLTKLTADKSGIQVEGEPTVQITLIDDSVIKLLTSTQEEEEIMMVLENEAIEGEEDPNAPEAPDNPVADDSLYVSVKESGKNATAINNYLKAQKQDFHISDTTLDLSQPLTILGEDKNTTLNKDGFIEIQLKEGAAPQAPASTGTNKKPKPKPEEPAEPTTPATPTTMYRLYNRLTGEHLFTTDKNERDNLLTSDTWKDEGEGWTAPSVSDYPVYRLLNPNTSDHHYTTDKNEFDTLPSYGWVAEGVAFFSADKDNPENVILHRLYNPNAQGAGMHHYTADTNERDTLVAQGWKYEGTAWAGLKN